VVEYLCDRVAVMYLGKIVELAPAEELFRRTLHPYTQSLIAAVPRMDGRRGEKTVMLNGEALNQPLLISGNAGKGCAFASRCPEAANLRSVDPQSAERCHVEEPCLREAGKGHWVSCHRIS
jgi:oligopeptide/dipeptide ABC transporter ATP-binding protein